MRNNTLFFIVFILLSANVSFGQIGQELNHRKEIGFFLGGYNYSGDLSPGYNFSFIKPGGSLFYRYNFDNDVTVFRVQVGYGTIAADESKYDNALPKTRKLSFSKSMVELLTVFEYNFFNYRDPKQIYYMSPYLFGGMGVSLFPGSTAPTFVSFPFGVGVKYKVSKHINVGCEFGPRKIVSSKLDDYDDLDALNTSYSTEWIYFVGLNLSYTFYNQICPDYSPRRQYNF